MSGPLAIAAVTAVLRDLLNNALIDQDVSGALGGNVTVSALPPDRLFPAGGAETDQLNLFLHQVTPNTGWSNHALPSRDGRGDRLTNPPLALDLHYLLTAYGTDNLHAEVLLGYGMHVLHENPVLTRGGIRHALTTGGVNGSILPPGFAGVQATDLADQVEQIKISPVTLSSEELSKLWSALQASYRPTAAYLASVVLIEAAEPARTPLPVLSRGQFNAGTGKEGGVVVQPHLVPPYPTLERVEPPASQAVARMGETLIFTGHHLDAPQVLARFTDARQERTLELPTANALGGGFEVDLPPVPPVGPPPGPGDPRNPENWRSGPYQVAGVLRSPIPGVPDRLTNELTLTLAPRIDAINVAVAAGETVLDVDVAPPVWRGQRASLVVGTTEIAADPLTADRVAVLRFRAPSADLPSGPQWVRLLVDGVASVLIDRSGPFPIFDPTQSVVL